VAFSPKNEVRVFRRDEDYDSVKTDSDGDQALLTRPHEQSGDLEQYMKEDKETPATENHIISREYG
jgi:hypothetical protein